MGHVYDGQGNNHRAAEWYKKAVEASPKQARNLNFLGDSLAKLGKISEAENCFRKATRCKEGPVDEAYYNLGVLLGAQGRYKMALVCFEKAVGLDPNYKFAKQGMNDMSRVLQIKGISNNPQQRSAK
jgi:superkiller protein 3